MVSKEEGEGERGREVWNTERGAGRTRIWREGQGGLKYGERGRKDLNTEKGARRTRIWIERHEGLKYGKRGREDSNTGTGRIQICRQGQGGFKYGKREKENSSTATNRREDTSEQRVSEKLRPGLRGVYLGLQ